MNSIISPTDALLINDAVIVDARAGGPDAHTRYQNGHIQNALYVDLDKDLSKKPENAAFGGRHPLPDVKDFGLLLGRLGIKLSTHVLVYDDKGGANAAARFWWMMKAVGHEKIQVVDGGLNAMIKAGAVLTCDVPTAAAAGHYPVQPWKLPLADLEVVEQASSGKMNLKVVDVRESYRYRGESEPIDLVAGHIPNALNIPFLENLNEMGNFKSPQELKEQYLKTVGDNPQEVIVHCGSGVTACHTLLAMDYAGYSGAKLYVGSWSEWSRRGKSIEVN